MSGASLRALAERHRWVVAIALAVAAVGVRHALAHWASYQTPFVIAFPAVVLAAWIGGFWPGMLTLCVAMFGTMFAGGTDDSFPRDAAARLRLAVGLPTLVLVCIVCEQLRRSRARAEARAESAEAGALAEQHLRLALDASKVSLFDMDRDLRYTWVYRPAFGLAPPQVLGVTADELFKAQPEVAERLTRVRREVMATGRAASIDLAYDVKGETLHFDMVISPLRDVEGRLIGVTNAAIEITERKRAEERARLEIERALERERAARREAEAANRLKDDFLSNLSHELRTPLNAILGWAHILLSDRVDHATARRGVQAIERAARNQASLVEELLDMNAIMAGKVRLDPQPLDPAQLVARAVETVLPIAREKTVAITVDADDALPPVSGDPKRLQQVLWNLLHNAIKFSARDGEVRVAVTRGDDRIVITVADSGEGIDAAFLPHVFDRFRQQDGSVTRAHGGLGLGLAIVRHLVELHGGSVEAASEGRGRGARFTVRLPLAAMDLPTPPERHPDADDAEALAGLRVLVVDDDADSRDMTMALLAGRGAEARAVPSAHAALALLASEAFDALVSDIAMPEMDGIELLERLRADPANPVASMYAIAVTAYAGERESTRAREAGFDRIVPKPVDADALVAALATVATTR